MSEDYLIQHCAPTLAGIKTASLFTCPYDNPADLLDSIRRMNKWLTPKGLRLLPLRFSEKKALIYLYRPKKLSADLEDATAARLLRRCGYDCQDCEKCVACLGKKLRQQSDFPHEIGLFLGYPPEDVQGFMDRGPDACKCTGCWRVYSNVESAQKKFAQFKKCSRVYRDKWAQKGDIHRLTVNC